MAEGEGRGEGFLSRWSRLKQARREGGEAEVRPAPAPAAAPDPAPAPPLAEAPNSAPGPAPLAEPEPEIDLASLPRIEDLTAGSDVAAFLRKGVPAALRNAALRRVWSVDPDIRDFIGPADYAWDWNVPGGAPGYAETIAHGPDVEALADRILGIGRETREPAPRGPEAVAEAPAEAQEDTAQPEAPAAAPDAAAPVVAAVPSPAPAEPPLPAAPASPPARPRHGGAVPA
jgi:hypothetical protein